VIAAVFLPGDLTGQSYVELKEAMEQTTVNENVGGEIPLKSRFMALDGNWYNLGEFFFEDRPVFLSLNYADCPQLCKNQLKTLAERFTEAKLVPGTDFEFISISLDPKEAHKRTREAKANFCRLLGIPTDDQGVHFLVGRKSEIDAVANSIGFVYSYVPAARHYSHAPLCVALSPNGKISRYIHGLAFTAENLEESTLIAADEKVADESIASFVYRCLLFGVNPGQYTKDLLGLMKVAGAATVIIVGACVIPFWFRPTPRTTSNVTAPSQYSPADTPSADQNLEDESQHERSDHLDRPVS
jgi:protein SCO1/2